MKRISPGTVTVGVIAILFGLVAAYAARRYFEQTAPAAQAPRPAMATIVVPKVNLPKYVRIRDQDVDLIEVPKENVPEGAVQLKSRVLFRLVKTTIMAGQPILEEQLYGVGEVPLLSDQLPPGHRAVTLSVDASAALNGMIQPESYVDVTLTANSDRPEFNGLATLTLLRNIEVLATSLSRFPASEDRPGDLRNITVAVTPEQANKLILAQRYGTLSVTLRSSAEGEPVGGEMIADADSQEIDLVNTLDLLGLGPLPAPQPEVVPAPATKTVQIWRGTSVEEVTFDATALQEAENVTAAAEGREPIQITSVGSEASRTSQPAAAKKDCPSCNKKSKQPTPAPIQAGQPTAARSDGSGSRPLARSGGSQILEVRVEAEQAGVQ